MLLTHKPLHNIGEGNLTWATSRVCRFCKKPAPARGEHRKERRFLLMPEGRGIRADVLMTDKLQEAIKQAEGLSQADQDALAEVWLLLIDELGWERRFADPHNQEKMQRMAEEALCEHAAGKTEELP